MPAPTLTLLIDGACPLCRWEGRLLRRLDRGRGRLAIRDISAPDFDPAAYGVSAEAIDREIHAVLPTGRVIRGMEVFRRAYDAVGWGWLLAPTGWPLLKWAFDRAYAWFARNRRRLTGRARSCDDGCTL